MAGRADFTDEEWASLAHAQLATGYLAASAEGGRRHFVDEMFAAFEVLRDRSVEADSQLVREVSGAHSGTQPLDQWQAEGEQRLLADIAAAVALVEARAPAEAEAFRDHLVSLAEQTAAASKVGGFLGIGGTRVGPAEQARLDAIRAAVRPDRA